MTNFCGLDIYGVPMILCRDMRVVAASSCFGQKVKAGDDVRGILRSKTDEELIRALDIGECDCVAAHTKLGMRLRTFFATRTEHCGGCDVFVFLPALSAVGRVVPGAVPSDEIGRLLVRIGRALSAGAERADELLDELRRSDADRDRITRELSSICDPCNVLFSFADMLAPEFSDRLFDRDGGMSAGSFIDKSDAIEMIRLCLAGNTDVTFRDKSSDDADKARLPQYGTSALIAVMTCHASSSLLREKTLTLNVSRSDLLAELTGVRTYDPDMPCADDSERLIFAAQKHGVPVCRLIRAGKKDGEIVETIRAGLLLPDESEVGSPATDIAIRKYEGLSLILFALTEVYAGSSRAYLRLKTEFFKKSNYAHNAVTSE